MKQIYNTTLAAIAVLIAASCAKEKLTPVEAAVESETNYEMVPVTLNVATELSEAKSYISDNNKIFWELGDSIAVYTDVSGAAYKFKAVEVDGKNVLFSGCLPKEKTDIFAVYPYTAAQGYTAEGNVSLTFPSEQVVTTGNVAKNAVVSVVSGNIANTLTFKNVFGVIKVTINNEDAKLKIKSIGLEGTNLAGDVTVNADGGIVSVDSPDSCVTVTMKDGSTFAKNNVFYAAVLPSTTEAGKFVITMDCPSEIAGLQFAAIDTLHKVMSVERCGIAKFESNNKALMYGYQIHNMTDFETWRTAVPKIQGLRNVFLRTDLDFGRQEIDPVPVFAGYFWGNNHKVYNYRITDKTDRLWTENTVTGFFIQLDADSFIRDLVLGMDPATGKYDGYSCITTTHKRPGTNNCFTGGLVGLAKGIDHGLEVTNVKNYATLVFAPNVAEPASIRYGGIVGQVGQHTKAVIDKCENYGKIEYSGNLENSAHRSFMSGIVAFINSDDSEITNCKNYGEIGAAEGASFTCTSSKGYFYVGGIVARYLTGMKSASIKNCANYGKLSMTNNLQNLNLVIGGIVAGDEDDQEHDPVSYGDSSLYVYNCNNYGAIEFGSQSKPSYIGGIAGKLWTPALIKECQNAASIHKTGDSSNDGTAIGGIVGQAKAYNPTIKGCTNTAAGSILDDGQSSNHSVYAGGILGLQSSGKVTSCTNNATVTLSGNSPSGEVKNYAGGIIGGTIAAGGKVSACTNNGDISSTAKDSDGASAGGLVGFIDNFQLSSGYCTGGCTVNCDVQSAGVTNKPFACIVGRINGTTSTINLGASDDKIKVKKSCTITINNVKNALSEDDTNDYYWQKWLAGPINGITESGVAVNNHTVWAELVD